MKLQVQTEFSKWPLGRGVERAADEEDAAEIKPGVNFLARGPSLDLPFAFLLSRSRVPFLKKTD